MNEHSSKVSYIERGLHLMNVNENVRRIADIIFALSFVLLSVTLNGEYSKYVRHIFLYLMMFSYTLRSQTQEQSGNGSRKTVLLAIWTILIIAYVVLAILR